jgi:SAM-dependent methyltransferase
MPLLQALVPVLWRSGAAFAAGRRTRWPAIGRRTRVKTIDLRKTVIGGEGQFHSGRWADATGNPRRASILLQDSPHVHLLEQYRALGESLFDCNVFGNTPYFTNASQAARLCGSYFGHRTADGIAAQARSFVQLYERTARGDRTEVDFTYRGRHSAQGSLPIVRETLTRDVFQIGDGHHRLAVAWALGYREVRAAVTPRRSPTPLQSLVLRCAQTHGRRELYQPVDGIEFDGSWGLVRRCRDRLAMMLEFLEAAGQLVPAMSVLDLACSYGWFVREFAQRGSAATGVDSDPSALKIGRIAYGLRPDQTVQSDLRTFLSGCDRTWDVVLLLSVLHHFVLRRTTSRPEDLLRQVDRITGTCLFLDTGQAHERWWRGSLSAWDNGFVIEFIRRHTSFTRVVPLGIDGDDTGPYRDNYRRTLFACLRAP